QLGVPSVFATILDGQCGHLTAQAYNVVTDPSCGGGPGTTVGRDPMLGPLQDNGGPTAARAVPASRPADEPKPNAANNHGGANALGAQTCATTDQRGISYFQRGASACDVGAYQVEAPTTYVANPSAGSVTAYSAGAAGDATPVLTLSGANTGLNHPQGVLADV